MDKYVFDVDGTLTEPRKKITTEMEVVFEKFIAKNPGRVYLLTGSDKEKTIEQVGRKIWGSVISYQCAGNEIYAYGSQVFKAPDLPYEDKLIDLLNKLLKNSKFPKQYGNHIEKRAGGFNFSTIGRNCSYDGRVYYQDWDLEEGERLSICAEIQKEFPELQASIGGQISVDIFPRGKDKAQVYQYIKEKGSSIYFFADRPAKGGNDYPFVCKMGPSDRLFPVTSYRDTLNLLTTV